MGMSWAEDTAAILAMLNDLAAAPPAGILANGPGCIPPLFDARTKAWEYVYQWIAELEHRTVSDVSDVSNSDGSAMLRASHNDFDAAVAHADPDKWLPLLGFVRALIERNHHANAGSVCVSVLACVHPYIMRFRNEGKF